MGEYVAAFFLEALLEKAGLSVFIGAACRPLASIRRLSFKKSFTIREGLFLFIAVLSFTQSNIVSSLF